MTTEQPDPPRRPLLVLLSGVEVVPRPGDPIAEEEDGRAVAAYRSRCIPMRYADEETPHTQEDAHG